MDALIYPIVLDPVSGAAKTDPFLSDKAKGWAITVRQRSESLAEATGGKVSMIAPSLTSTMSTSKSRENSGAFTR